jgi:methanogenic corrinoid protein MtbC1
MLALSVATVFNLDQAQRVIQIIKNNQETRDIKIMVGGLAFNDMPELWQNIGADGSAANAESALIVSSEWWNLRNS